MTEKNSKDEIDILSLFSLIGKKSNSLLVLIINFFISFLNLIISILYLFKRNYLILLISLIIGSLTGYFYEKNLYVPQYKTTLTLSPNFGSTYHLYENIKFYQSLIDQKDFEKLNVYLNLDSTDAKFLTSISIKPYKNESLNLKNFKKLLSTADSTTSLSLSYKEFADKIPFESYSFHVITLKTTKSKIPIQLEQSIIKSLEKNEYYSSIKIMYLKNLEIKKEYVKSSIQKLDTLLFSKNFNTEESSKRGNLGTTILLEESKNQNIELKLFDRYTFLRDELIKINYEMENKKNVINTIDSFKFVGRLNNHIAYMYYGAFILFLITFFTLSLLELYNKLVISKLLNIKKLGFNEE